MAYKWDKELEALKILAKEKETHNLYRKHKDKTLQPTLYTKVGYCKESVMHSDYFAWAKNSYIKELYLRLLHIPNEFDSGDGDAAVKAGIKIAMGIAAGAPDFLNLYAYPTIFPIEFKLVGEKLNENQVRLHENWRKIGIHILTLDNFELWRYVTEGIIVHKGAFLPEFNELAIGSAHTFTPKNLG